MTEFPKDICGVLLSQIEESYPMESDNNVKWIVQQIVHSVCAARTGLSAAEQVRLYSHIRNCEIYICSFV